MNIEPVDMNTESAEVFDILSSIPPSPQTLPVSSLHTFTSQQQAQTNLGNSVALDMTQQAGLRQGIQSEFSSSVISSDPINSNQGSLLQSMQDVRAQVFNEITNQGITSTIFSKVVLNEPCDTLNRIFQYSGVGYEHYVQMIESFLASVSPEERAKRYSNVGRVLAETREDVPVDDLSRETILEVIQQTKAEMSRMGLTQMLFAKVVLGRTAGIVSQMLKFNGVGYEKHIHTIRSFLTRPVEERRMLYRKGVAPSTSDNLPTNFSFPPPTVPLGLLADTSVVGTAGPQVQSVKGQKSACESPVIIN